MFVPTASGLVKSTENNFPFMCSEKGFCQISSLIYIINISITSYNILCGITCIISCIEKLS
jgi:hypothetical protein